MGKSEGKKSPFHERFIDEAKLATLGGKDSATALWADYFSVFVLSMVLGTFGTFFGYDFRAPVIAGVQGSSLLLILALAFFFGHFLILSKRRSLFRKPSYPCLFLLPPVLLAVGICAFAACTVKTEIGAEGAFSVQFDPLPYFAAYLPLFLGYMIFTYYAFAGALAKKVQAEKKAQREGKDRTE